MFVQSKWRALGLENVGAGGMQRTLVGERADVGGALVMRVDLDERLGPVPLLCVELFDLVADIRGRDRGC